MGGTRNSGGRWRVQGSKSWETIAAVGLVLFTALLTRGKPVPWDNELTYLTSLRHFADPTYLAGDWTFAEGFDEHFVWLRLFAPLVNLFGIVALGWAGRLLSWTAIAVLFVLIGRRLGARPLLTGFALVIWIGLDQSMGVADTSMILGFEASGTAYPVLLGAVLLAINQRVGLALFLSGLAFSIHPSVGLWGSGALALSLLAIPDTRKSALHGLWLLIVAALPGAIPQLNSFLNSSISSDDAAFVALTHMPMHLDPFSWGLRPFILLAMVTFNLLLHARLRANFAHLVIGWVQAFLLVPVVLGVVARLTSQYWFMLLFPFRVLPVLGPAIFLINMAALMSQGQFRTSLGWRRVGMERLLTASGIVAIVGIVLLFPPLTLARGLSGTIKSWTQPVTDFERALQWIADETPPGSQILGSPKRTELFSITERPQYVAWMAITYDRVHEWRRRIEAVTPLELFELPRAERPWDDAFAALPQDQLLSLTPAVDYVVTTARYDLPEVFAVGEWSVYEVSLASRRELPTLRPPLFKPALAVGQLGDQIGLFRISLSSFSYTPRVAITSKSLSGRPRARMSPRRTARSLSTRPPRSAAIPCRRNSMVTSTDPGSWSDTITCRSSIDIQSGGADCRSNRSM